jgi:hypothetical protein
MNIKGDMQEFGVGACECANVSKIPFTKVFQKLTD